MDRRAGQSGLEEVLRQQICCAEALNTALLKEQEILPHHEATALSTAAARKAELIDRLNQLEERRRSLWPTGPVSLDGQWELPDGQGNPTIGGLWGSLIAELTRCRELNEANRQILDVEQEAVTRALSVLAVPASDNPLYGAHGRRMDSPGSHPLAKA